jgi:hypothetical protein
LPQDEIIEEALKREAGSVAQHLGIGATAIGKADYDRTASYAEAFFALSVAFERGAKLALTLDAAARDGRFLSRKTLSTFSHDLDGLLRRVEDVARARNIADAELPDSGIHRAIVMSLTGFAMNVGRYYNLEVLAPGGPSIDDPIAAWYRTVRRPVLAAHYGAKQRARVEKRIERIAVPATTFVSIIATAETGEAIRSLPDMLRRNDEARVAHPWERMYVLQLARFLTRIIAALGGAAQREGLPVPFLEEFFYRFQLEDRDFRRRKIWTIES